MTSRTKIPSDIDIAQKSTLKPIVDIAETLGLSENDLELFGKFKAKITYDKLKKLRTKKEGDVILVTAINPTPAGEGKSTVTVGLGDAFTRLGKKTVIAMREPSLGPVLGVKGGATGGGYSQVLPMDEINLHFTGDLHAITTANNALAALIDNHIHQGNLLNIDPRRIQWKRAIDMNDRALRNVVIGLGGPAQGVPREEGFDISVASEIMAILCLATDLNDLKNRIGKIVIGYTYEKQPVSVKNLGVEGALTLLLKDALKPNLVQTIAHTPALIHGGPFANIAHGCNSVMATKAAAMLGEIVVTEAGFGADLGAEKFLHIKTPISHIKPKAVVIVATIRALKMHGGIAKDALIEPNVEALHRGLNNLEKHIDTMEQFHLPFVVAINKFITDSDEEVNVLKKWCKQKTIPFALTEVWEKGGAGGEELAKILLKEMQATKEFTPLYEVTSSIEEKIESIAKKVYGASSVEFSQKAKNSLLEANEHGWGELPICMAKTQYSLSHDPKLLGRPESFVLYIRDLVPRVGAGFLIALTGDVMTMPGLPKEPAAYHMDVDAAGKAQGLF
ncbi:formate--tetrahydrofolate ligase [Bacillus sp. 2205SS5-2]|uniref:formate--tetrahydrofolate ligase n=1 Tax=Bacillus sp. 2205SS5-2 TaxID=3109031 RepID=UPI0030074415